MDRRGIKAGCRIKGAALQADDGAAAVVAVDAIRKIVRVKADRRRVAMQLRDQSDRVGKTTTNLAMICLSTTTTMPKIHWEMTHLRRMMKTVRP